MDGDIQNIGKGTVILWEKFEFFTTGEKKDSRFLILSKCHSEYKTFLAIRATTKTEFYEKPSNILKEFIIIPPKTEKPLPAKSIIDLGRITTLSWSAMNPFWGAGISKIGFVSNELIIHLDKLVNNSKTIRRDWKQWILTSTKTTQA